MRRTLAGVAVLLGLAAAGVVRADHARACPPGADCGPEAKAYRLSLLGGHKLFDHRGADECKPHHRLWPFNGHKLFSHAGHGSGHAGCAHGGCGYHPWFNTFKGCPDPSLAFPAHPFARSPRDFFMYEW